MPETSRGPENILAAAEEAQKAFEAKLAAEEERQRQEVGRLKNQREQAIGEEKRLAEGVGNTKRVYEQGTTRIQEIEASGRPVSPALREASRELDQSVQDQEAGVESAFEKVKDIEKEPGVMDAVEDEARTENNRRDNKKMENEKRAAREENMRLEVEQAKEKLEQAKTEVHSAGGALADLWKEDAGWALRLTKDATTNDDYAGQSNGLAKEIGLLEGEISGKKHMLERKTFFKGGLQKEIDSLQKEVTTVNEKREKLKDKYNSLLEKSSELRKQLQEKVAAYEVVFQQYANKMGEKDWKYDSSKDPLRTSNVFKFTRRNVGSGYAIDVVDALYEHGFTR